MKKTIFFATVIAVVLWSCDSKTNKQNGDTQTEAESHHHADGHEHEHSSATSEENKLSEGETITVTQSTYTSSILNAYLSIKEALTNDDQQATSKAGTQLANSTNSFDISSFTDDKQKELNEIMEVVKEHGEHIAKSEIGHQRGHFEMLARDIKDLVVIAGSDRTLYQQYCPMYNDNKGGTWLSASNEVKNPLFGSKMLKCGKVQQEITVQ